MKLEELLLKKEEIPILPGEGRYYRGGRFVLPIYPKLLSKDVAIDPELANKVFKRAAEDWLADMKKEGQIKKSVKISIRKKHGLQIVHPFNFEAEVTTIYNGFVKGIAINSYQNLLFIEPNSPLAVIPEEGTVKFSTEKFEAYCCGCKSRHYANNRADWYDMYLFRLHNPGHYPELLFLRNWGILYVNEALKQVFSK
jgi:hypothetical protein